MGIRTCRRPRSTASRLPARRIPACRTCTAPAVQAALRRHKRKSIPMFSTTTITTALTTTMSSTAITHSRDRNMLRRPCRTLEERRLSSTVRDQLENTSVLFLHRDRCMSGPDKVIPQSSSRSLRIKERRLGIGQARTLTSRNTTRAWSNIAIENAMHSTERSPREIRARWSLVDARQDLRCLLSTTAATDPWPCPSSWRPVIPCSRRLPECHPRT